MSTLASIYIGFLVTAFTVAGCNIRTWPKRPIEWVLFAALVIPTLVLAGFSIAALDSIKL